ncbi:hypothetical protein [Clostridium isatidis]|uniref:hypothetical protein n=1 Tax=Clostridium isatidis TaxID=182773 RepID=UPI003AAD3D46
MILGFASGDVFPILSEVVSAFLAVSEFLISFLIYSFSSSSFLAFSAANFSSSSFASLFSFSILLARSSFNFKRSLYIFSLS